MSPAGFRPERNPRAAILFGLAVGFVVAVDGIRVVRPSLLLDPEPSWAIPRLLIFCFVLTVSTCAGVLAAVAFFFWSGTRLSKEPYQALPLSGGALAALTGCAIVLAGFFRFVGLGHIPAALFVDEVCPIPAALGLKGSWTDFADSIRFLFFDVYPRGFIGVLYLEGYRLLLKLWGTTVFGVRSHVALAGTLSVVTAALLGRALLPRGGGALAAISLAGLRWSLIVSRFAWNPLALAPIADVATLILIRARRRASWRAALAGGLVAGIGAHVYLASWIVALALMGFLFWPGKNPLPVLRRVGLAAVFFAGFLLAASPIVLLRKDRVGSYLVRASDQTLAKEIRRSKTWMPPFAILADAFQAPWFLPDPVLRQDLRKSRLGWLVGIPVAIAFLRAMRSPREDLSALFFGHAGAACAASLYWGQPGHPNGVRFVYLSTVTAVAAAAGALWIVQSVSPSLRRTAGIVVIGCLGISGFLGARDALLRWGDSQRTFEEFWGEDTLFGRAAMRWERFGRVTIDPKLPHNQMTVEFVRRYRLDPDEPRQERSFFSGRGPSRMDAGRCFRIVPAEVPLRGGERLVERVRDGGRDWAVVFGMAGCQGSRP